MMWVSLNLRAAWHTITGGRSQRAKLSTVAPHSELHQWWSMLSVQLILFFVIPLAIVLSVGAFLSITWHESAMQDLVRARDERAVQLAADDLATRIEQHRMGLALIQQHLDSGLTLARLAADEPYLVEMFDRGVFLRGEQASSWPPDALACTTDRPDVILLTHVQADFELVGCVSLTMLGFPQIADQLHSNHAVVIYLVDDQGRLRFRTDGGTLDESILDRLNASAVLQGKPGSTEIKQGGMTVAYSPVSGMGWGMIMAEPWHEITNSRL